MEKKSYYHFIVYYKDKLVFDGDEHALKEMAPSFEAKPPYKVLVPVQYKLYVLLLFNYILLFTCSYSCFK